ncbi:MAG: transporter [Actinomycetia bacterium]|nr:transporter [Actinomycetes bacterium]MCP5031608.1 transporter [Actinomycetes bacterium]
MGSVGLLYVGAILFLNGAMLLGWVEGKSAGPLNLFVGILQVVTPTYLIFTAAGDENAILGASGIYLFGFTYLYVAMNVFFDLDGSGLGYFSGFVTGCALVFAGLNFWREGFGDNGFGVIWLYWAFLWGLFFVVLGLGRESLGRYTGGVAAVEGIVTGAIPAFLLLTGNWTDNTDTAAIVLAIFGVVAFVVLWPVLRESSPAPDRAAAGAT